MKKFKIYTCDSCHKLLGTQNIYAVSVSHIRPDGTYEVDHEHHFCANCLRIVDARIGQSVREFA